jgi:hypothetical protein
MKGLKNGRGWKIKHNPTIKPIRGAFKIKPQPLVSFLDAMFSN